MNGSFRTARRLLPVVALSALVPLAACSSGSGSTTGAGPSSPSSPSGSGAPTQAAADLQAAAEKEGSITWYATFSEKDVTGIAQRFNEKYPNIKINMLQGSIDKLTARIGTEQKGGKYNADLIQGSATYIVQLAHDGALQPYEPADRAPAPPEIKLPEGYANIDVVLTNAIAYNPKVLEEKGMAVPTSYEDLTKPEWKGKFSADARDVGWYESLIDTMGHDKALALVKAIGANSPRIVESHTQAVTQVQSGEPIATIAAYGYKAAAFKAKTPDTVDFVNTNPLPASPDLIEMVKNAPHPNAAKLFMNWYLSKDGQQAIADVTGQISLRDDVKNVEGAWDPGTWKPAWSEPTLDSATFNKYTDELKAALGAQ